MNKYYFSKKVYEKIYYLDTTHPDIPNESLITSKFTLKSYLDELDNFIQKQINNDINEKNGEVYNFTFRKEKPGKYIYSYDTLNEEENTLSKYLGEIKKN